MDKKKFEFKEIKIKEGVQEQEKVEPKRTKVQDKSLERVDEEDDETDEEYFYKMNQGLVKI